MSVLNSKSRKGVERPFKSPLNTCESPAGTHKHLAKYRLYLTKITTQVGRGKRRDGGEALDTRGRRRRREREKSTGKGREKWEKVDGKEEKREKDDEKGEVGTGEQVEEKITKEARA